VAYLPAGKVGWASKEEGVKKKWLGTFRMSWDSAGIARSGKRPKGRKQHEKQF